MASRRSRPLLPRLGLRPWVKRCIKRACLAAALCGDDAVHPVIVVVIINFSAQRPVESHQGPHPPRPPPPE